MKSILISLLIFSSSIIYCQDKESTELTLVYYNVDQLYDFTDDEGDYDNDFTASGSRFWGQNRYSEKLDAVSGSIASINKKSLPGILILSGIENKSVLKDLLETKPLRKSKYKEIIHENKEGESLAVLYSPGIVNSIDFKSLEIPSIKAKNEVIIIYAKLELNDGNIYHLFLNKWPDRSSLTDGSENSRMNCAVVVRKEIDKILNFETEARIIVVGTFNDEPTNRSMLSMLNATNKRKNMYQRDLYNLFYDAHNNLNDGTVEINGSKQMFDYFIVSPALLKPSNAYYTDYNSAYIHKAGQSAPLPTFKGEEYLGGAGSHFPVYIKLQLEK